tara:strand:+ start:447 stop:2342 length:1896 start_codon:yes stop_codon:yes gene_type:complete
MAITDRKLFAGASPKINSRGTGITSGLVDDDSQFSSDFEQQRRILESIRPPQQEFSRFSAASPALLALGSALLSGKSLQGGVGGALDILGQGAGASAPLFADAINRRKAFEAAQRKEGFDLDLTAYNAALDLSKTRATAKAKAKVGESKPVWYVNPDFNQDKPISSDNLKYIESVRRVGTDGQLRIRNLDGDFVSENNFPNYMVSDPVKIQTLKDGDVWIMNPDYEGKDPNNMYLNSKFKRDGFGNVTILDKRPGSPTENDYVPEENFKDFRYTEPKEAMESEGEKIRINKIEDMVQSEFDRLNKSQGKPTRKLSNKELNTILQRAGTDEGDWNKFSQQYAETFNELASILKDYQDDDQPQPEISVEFDGKKTEEEQESNVNKKVYDIETQPDYIDKRFNLDKSDPNYEINRKRSEREYRLIDPIPGPVQDAMNSAFSGFKDLKMIVDNIDEGVPFFGGLKRITSTLGLDRGATEFLTGQDGTLVSSTAALIKGIPSDFDVQNLKNTLPSISQSDSVNIIRAKRLQRMYNDIVKNALAWHSGLGNRIPMSIEVMAREMIGNQAVDEAMSLQYTQEKLNDLRSMTKEDYIKKYGDPFQESMNILNIPDSELLPKLNESEQSELEAFEKKYIK